MKRKNIVIISIITIAAIFSAGAIYVCTKMLGPQTVPSVPASSALFPLISKDK